MNYELELKDQDTKRRCVEVMFYIMTKGLTNSYEAKAVIESLAEFFGCKPSVINVVYQNSLLQTHQPSRAEQVIVLKLLGYGTRKIGRVLQMNTRTIYMHLDDYINAGALGLAPRFDLKTDQEIARFNSKLANIFGPGAELFNVKER